MTFDPISYDGEAVADARQQCRRVASALAAAGDARRREADDARDDWLGRWREDFDRRLAALDGEADDLRHRLLRAVAALDEAVDDVERENRRRDVVRAELAVLRADVVWLAAEPAAHRYLR